VLQEAMKRILKQKSRTYEQGRPWQMRGPMQDLGAGAPLSSDFMTLSCSVNRVTIVVECRYAVQH